MIHKEIRVLSLNGNGQTAHYNYRGQQDLHVNDMTNEFVEHVNMNFIIHGKQSETAQTLQLIYAHDLFLFTTYIDSFIENVILGGGMYRGKLDSCYVQEVYVRSNNESINKKL